VFGGTGDGEGVMIVKPRSGTMLVFTDALMSIQKLRGFGGFMMGLFGFTGPKPKVSRSARMVLVEGQEGAAGGRGTPGRSGSSVWKVAHGAPITVSPTDGLREAAAGL
jgi:hypothetical protein